MIIPEPELLRVFKQIGRISVLMGAALCLTCLPLPVLVVGILVQQETGIALWPSILTPGLVIIPMVLGGGVVGLLDWKRQALLQRLRVPGPLPKNFERGRKIRALFPFALAIWFLMAYGGSLLFSSMLLNTSSFTKSLLVYLTFPLAGLVWYLLCKLVR